MLNKALNNGLYQIQAYTQLCFEWALIPLRALGFSLHFTPSSYMFPILKQSKKFLSVFKGHLVFMCTPKKEVRS